MTSEQKAVLLKHSNEIATEINRIRNAHIAKHGYWIEMPSTYRELAGRIFMKILDVEYVTFSDLELMDVFAAINKELVRSANKE